jgi:hypothetical protein
MCGTASAGTTTLGIRRYVGNAGGCVKQRVKVMNAIFIAILAAGAIALVLA